MKYYSQYGQDKFLNEKIFKGKRNGFFLDIGANDGITFSNTYFFEKELGWQGICFEPLKNAFQKLQNCRTSININACASTEDKTDYFLSVAGYGEMLSGLKSKYDERHSQRLHDTIREHGGQITEMEIECRDVNKILETNAVLNIDFISIDTEGNELEILRGINYDKVHIKVIVVENNYRSDVFKTFLNTKGFEKISRLETDEVYVNRTNFGFFKRFSLKYFATR